MAAQPPARLRISTRFPFPAGVAGAAPIVITKLNGIWTVSLNIAALGVQTPLPANYATNFVLVYDSLGLVTYRMPLSGLVPLVGLIETIPVVVNFNSANTDTQIPIQLPPGYTRYKFTKVTICNSSGSLTTSTVGLFAGAGGTGFAVVAGASANTVSTNAESTNGNTQDMTLAAQAPTITWQLAGNPVWFWRVGTAQGVAATGTVIITVQPIP